MSVIKTVKVMLVPNNKQRTKLFQSAGTARFAYNWALGYQQMNYDIGNDFMSDCDLRKVLTSLKSTDKLNWMNGYSNNITKQAVKDACNAYMNFFKGKSKYPKFKSKKKKRRLQRRVSKKYLKNKKGNNYCKTSNIIKSERQLLKVNHQLTNIRHNYLNQATAETVNRKPKFIVLEDLNVKGMMKNKHLAKAVQEQCFYEFYRQIKYKCEWNNIMFITADRYFPSSKTCCKCGSVKSDLKLSDRDYICTDCGNIIDRDYQAALNLAEYGRKLIV